MNTLRRQVGRLAAGAVSVVLVVVTSGFTSGISAAPSAALVGVDRHPSAAQTAPLPLALTDLNAAFRRAYADARQRMLAEADPVIIGGADEVVLIRGGRRTEATANAPLYHVLKAIAHIPLAIYVTLTPGEGALTTDRAQTLEELRHLMPLARQSVAALGLSSVPRQESILAASSTFVDGVLARRQYTRDDLQVFIRGVVPHITANIADAARVQLDALHAQVSAWRREMSPAEWQRLRVIVVGSHMPRDEAIVTQYFSRLLNEPIEGRRIIYAEALWEESKALDLLGAHLLDGSMGEAFFGEFMRMHRDLLADAGKDYLVTLLPE